MAEQLLSDRSNQNHRHYCAGLIMKALFLFWGTATELFQIRFGIRNPILYFYPDRLPLGRRVWVQIPIRRTGMPIQLWNCDKYGRVKPLSSNCETVVRAWNPSSLSSSRYAFEPGSTVWGSGLNFPIDLQLTPNRLWRCFSDWILPIDRHLFFTATLPLQQLHHCFAIASHGIFLPQFHNYKDRFTIVPSLHQYIAVIPPIVSLETNS